MSEPHPIVIVGSGPAGYTAAIYTARSGFKPVVIAGSVTAGGALMNTTEVENFPGFPEGIQGPDLMASFEAQAKKFGADVVVDDATALDLTGPIKRVTLGSGDVVEARAIILAMGSKYRELGLEDEKRLSGRGVSWCATCDGFFYRDRVVAVVGGGDSAVEEATFLTRFASKVYMIHRRDALRASKIMADRAQANPGIEFVWNSEVVGVEGDDKVTGVTLKDLVTGETRSLSIDGLFVAIGHEPRSELVRDVVTTDAAGYVQVEGGTTSTNVPGVFAAGDLVDHRYRQAITAAGTGCSAALDAQHYLDRLVDESPRPKHPFEEAPTHRGLTRPIDATDSTFETEVLHADLPVVVDFWASWCAPCRAVSPILADLASEYANRIKVVKVDAESNPRLAADYAISNLPTIAFFRDGVVVKSVTGARNKSALEQLFLDHLG